MLQCPKCKDFVDNERNAFCPNCGTPLTEPVSPEETTLCPPVQETAEQPVQQQPPVQQPVYQYIQPGQPLPQAPQDARQVVYICQPAPRPKNGGAITGFVFGTIALSAMLFNLLSLFLSSSDNATATMASPMLIVLSIPGLVLGIVSTCRKSCTKRVFALLALIFSALALLIAMSCAIASAYLP